VEDGLVAEVNPVTLALRIHQLSKLRNNPGSQSSVTSVSNRKSNDKFVLGMNLEVFVDLFDAIVYPMNAQTKGGGNCLTVATLN